MELKGGDKLAKALADISSKMSSGVVSVGFMEGARYPDGTSVPAVAFWNEFGTVKSPPRPFFRTAISENSSKWAKTLAQAAKHYDYDAKKVLGVMGETIKQDIQSSINGWSDPKNADSTIAKKGFNSPLRDTMQMHDSVEYKVETS